ncbi:MAG: peptidase M23 [Deltaproteobacteria bacterium HGW-Deltaproteobacteria-4]|nr:MAG: peptidase M23 [Deltaproteobacteria bacterium HGW-Deltaproteobacteria-4]
MRKNRLRRPPRPFNGMRYVRFLLLIAVIAGFYGYLRDLKAPVIEVSPAQGMLSAQRPLTIKVSDSGSGLKSLRIIARQDGSETVLTQKEFSGEKSSEIQLDPGKTGLIDGSVEFGFEVRDQALFPFGNGNRAQLNLTLTLDRQPPQIELHSDTTPIWQGGAATIVYTVSEETGRCGVEADGLFFAGYRQSDGRYLCVVPFPVSANTATYVPKLVAVDLAGNETRVSPGLRLLARKFPQAKINVSDAFIAGKTEEFQALVPGGSGIDLFLKVNRDIRAENRKTLFELAVQSSATPLWSAAMLRMPRAMTTGAYAEARDYFYNGRLIDQQTHLGTDLASVAQAPILAANPGKVLFSGYFGLYGGCVILDHGLGVQTLYGHMSNLSVQVGQSVTRGEEIGRSGNTGMSGGDHLHFEVLVGGVPVRPEDWMEEKWMATYILDPMQK